MGNTVHWEAASSPSVQAADGELGTSGASKGSSSPRLHQPSLSRSDSTPGDMGGLSGGSYSEPAEELASSGA